LGVHGDLELDGAAVRALEDRREPLLLRAGQRRRRGHGGHESLASTRRETLEQRDRGRDAAAARRTRGALEQLQRGWLDLALDEGAHQARPLGRTGAALG